MIRQIGILLLVMMGSLTLAAQDTLPKFTLVDKGNGRIIVSWTNPYRDAVHQLSIQRSTDSTRNFKSILTLPDPTVPQNGYVDTKAPAGNVFYRLFILLDSGKYQFSKSKRPVPDTAKVVQAPQEQQVQQRIQETPKQVTRPPVTPISLPARPTNPKDSLSSIAEEKPKPKEIQDA